METKEYTDFAETFPSLGVFLSTIDSRPMNKVFADYEIECSKTGSKSFTTTKSYEEASELMIHGDSTNLDKLVAVDGVDTSRLRGSKKVNRLQKSVCGGFPLVPVYLTGVPKNMLASKKIVTKTKVINIIYNISVPGSLEASNIVKAGANMVSIIRYLERNGIRVNLYTIWATWEQKSNHRCAFFIKIKDAGAPLNLLNIAYPIINPSMLRRHGFKWLETIPIEIPKGDYICGYGSPVSGAKIPDCAKKLVDGTLLDTYTLLNKDPKTVINQIIKDITVWKR
jgi:hypothetical protein